MLATEGQTRRPAGRRARGLPQRQVEVRQKGFGYAIDATSAWFRGGDHRRHVGACEDRLWAFKSGGGPDSFALIGKAAGARVFSHFGEDRRRKKGRRCRRPDREARQQRLGQAGSAVFGSADMQATISALKLAR